MRIGLKLYNTNRKVWYRSYNYFYWAFSPWKSLHFQGPHSLECGPSVTGASLKSESLSSHTILIGCDKSCDNRIIDDTIVCCQQGHILQLVQWRASTIKVIDHDLHCYHLYGNNASRFIVPNITNKVKKKMCGPCISFEIFKIDIDQLSIQLNWTHQSEEW